MVRTLSAAQATKQWKVLRNAASTRQVFSTRKPQSAAQRKKPQISRRKLLPEEKKRQAAEKQVKRTEYNQALSEVQDYIWEKAHEFAATYGDHNAQWYYDDIMSRPQLTKSNRKISGWNVFQSLEVAALNNGK